MTEKESKYVEGEEFLEISFELPNVYEAKKLANEIMDYFKHAVNIKIIPCKIIVDPSRLAISKDDYHVTIYNYKQASQIIKG